MPTQPPSHKPTAVCFPFVGDSIGGSHLATLALLGALDPARVAPLVVVHELGPLTERLADKGISFVTYPISSYAGATPDRCAIAGAAWRNTPDLSAFLKSHNVAIVHTNDLRMHLTWAPAARWAGRRFVWHSHMILSKAASWRILAMAAHRIICPSMAALDSLPRNGRPKAEVIPSPFALGRPVDRTAARTALAGELGLDEDARIVGFVGNMTAQKRPQAFVAAAALVAERFGPDAAFVLAGDDRGGERAETQALAHRTGLAGAVHFLGYRDPIGHVIAAFDILVAPGVRDSFGRTLVEAMLVGTPVVAAHSGGHVDILEGGEQGIAVPPDDADALAGGIVRLLDDPQTAADLSARAQSRAVQRYGAEGIARRVMALYDGATSSAPASAPPVQE